MNEAIKFVDDMIVSAKKMADQHGLLSGKIEDDAIVVTNLVGEIHRRQEYLDLLEESKKHCSGHGDPKEPWQE
jgi:hypothetical protein